MMLLCFTNEWTVAVMFAQFFRKRISYTIFHNVSTNNDRGSWLVANEQLPRDLQISFTFLKSEQDLGLLQK